MIDNNTNSHRQVLIIYWHMKEYSGNICPRNYCRSVTITRMFREIEPGPIGDRWYGCVTSDRQQITVLWIPVNPVGQEK